MYPLVNYMYFKFPRINDSRFLIPDSTDVGGISAYQMYNNKTQNNLA